MKEEKMKFSETDKDIENVEAWAEVIRDVLFRVPADKRIEVLALASANEEAAAQERANSEYPGYVLVHAGEIDWMNSPGVRHMNVITRLESLLVQVLVRDIVNNHSPEDAARFLLAEHPHGTGSGLLQDYLPVVKRQKAASGA
jgi:hypothetical protein